ncbi:sensor histidine kinase [Herbiconiux liangxiaofengii]|uniref:sensor histidine kinase n=1 Tax=Herbiconiux liangxiaofengii TaxID=3342795 RepID=UPI0035B7A58C
MTGETRSAPAGRSAGDAISAASSAFAAMALLIAAVLVALRGVNMPQNSVWPALVVLAPLAALMLLSRSRARQAATGVPGRVVRVVPMPLTLVHLAVGTASIGLYAWVVIGTTAAPVVESPFILALPQVAFIYSVAPSVLGRRNLVVIGSAYLLSQGAVYAASVGRGSVPVFDGVTAALTAVVLLVGVSDLVSQRRSDSDARAVERARRDADADAYQREVEAQVVSLFHDTVLGELSVLALQQPGPLAPSLRGALERDLRMIEEGGFWPADEGNAHPVPVDDLTMPSGLCGVIADGRASGLEVDVAGDLASLQRLGADTAEALGLALGQVLVNAREHSGAGRVEIVVDGEADGVVVMASDAGAGFDPETVPADRLGVRQSIIARIQAVGGRTELFTSAGSGTAYLFSLPPTPENTWPATPAREVGRRPQAAASSPRSADQGEWPQRSVIGFLSWRQAPRSEAPIAAGALHPLLSVSAIAFTVLALARTATAGPLIVHPGFAIAAVAAVVLAGLIVIGSTDPVRTRVGGAGAAAFAGAVAAAVAADLLSAVSSWGVSTVLWTAWGPFVVGVTILSFSMFRPGRELALGTVLAAVLVGAASAAEVPFLPDEVSPLTAAVISVTPVVLLGTLASVFSYRMSLALMREAEAAARARHGLARRVGIRVREMLRDSGRARLSAELVPFFARVLAQGAVTDADAAEARRLSAVLRSEIIAGVRLPWLTRLVEGRPGQLVVHDRAGSAETLSAEQKVALRALVTALLAGPGRDEGVVEVRLTEVGGHRSVFVLAPWTGGEAAARRSYGSFIAVMNAAFGRSQITVEAGALRMLFADQRPRD